jgi:Ca-activated chloride channel family protein
MRTRIVAITLVVLLLAVVGAAQQGGAIAGVVTDDSGGVLPGVTVTLEGPERRTAVTNERGEFTFSSLLPALYRLQFTLTGFATVSASVAVHSGRVERLGISMTVAALTETITVSGESLELLQSQSAYALYPQRYAGPFRTEAYDHREENAFRRVEHAPLSTFSVDVDTASYANTRRFLNDGEMPPPGAVRIEELVNYFRFDYPPPGRGAPFSVTTELAECPWNSEHQLALIGLKGREVSDTELPPRSLVFLIDVSGSMDEPDKLPLVRHAMRMLVDTLTAKDRVAIVVYAGASGLVLPSTPGDRKATLQRAIADLEPGGSTNGAAGITLAYDIARAQFVGGGINRVVLATDGDFNVGVTSEDELVRLIERERASGVFLSVLGVGTGNLKDSTMEMLADKGNGNYSYLDSLHEARKVLVREAGGTLVTIAKDVKIQVEFNPRLVEAYRLIGYENRLLADEDFTDDAKDAGEIGAGHTVTALYEIVPGGSGAALPKVEPLKYQRASQRTRAADSNELANVKLRYKTPDGDLSRTLDVVLRRERRPLSANLGFASAVAEFGMLLTESKHAGSASFSSAVARATQFRGEDPEGYRAEFIKLVELADSLRRPGQP